jgi:pilin isopeptide linkage protein
MKRMHKIVAALLATVMTISMSLASVSLADGEVTSVGSLDVTKVVTVPTSGLVPEKTFTFEMTPKEAQEGSKVGNYNLYTGVLQKEAGTDLEKLTTEIEFTNGDAVVKDTVSGYQKTSNSNSFDLSELIFDHVGVYQYTVKEVTPAEDEVYLSYDRTEYTVYLYVGQSDDEYVILSAYSPNSTNTGKVPITFTNSAKTGSLVVSKTVEGLMGDKDKAFNFTITFGSHEALSTASSLFATKVSGDNKSEIEFAYNEETGHYEATSQVTLANGEYLRFDGLYTGMSYTVAEESYDGYTCTVETIKDSVGTGPAEKSSVTGSIGNGTSSNFEEFTNTMDHITDTGIVLDVAPYVLVALLTAAGLIVFAIRRRKMSR